MPNIFFVDAYAIIFRAYYAFLKSPIRSAAGHNISPVFGFTRFLNDLISKEGVDYIGVAFDPKGGNFRHQLYPLYKANRSETPEDIIKSTPIVKEILQAMRIPVLEVAGYEADDVIGTLSAKASATGGYTTYMVTPDKDYGQLIKPNVILYKPAKAGNGEPEMVGMEQICSAYGIADPTQVIDILALWGDASDNIPGVPGIGERGASKLVATYGTVENIIANVDKLTPKQRESILENIEQLRLARTLATISLDVPIDLDLEALKIRKPDVQELGRLYRGLGFRMMIRDLQARYPEFEMELSPQKSHRTVSAPSINQQQSLFDLDNNIIDPDESLLVKPTPVATPKVVAKPAIDQTKPIVAQSEGYSNINNTKHHYSTLTTVEEVTKLREQIEAKGQFCFDTQTTSVEPMRAMMVGLSIATEPGTAYWIPRNKEFLEILRPVFESEKITKIGHNIKYDLLIMRSCNIEVRGTLRDSMIIHYLLNPESRHSMDFLAVQTLGYEPVPIENVIGKSGPKQITMDRADQAVVADYAAEDADITLQLYEDFAPKLTARNQDELYDRIEEPLITVLADMECEGVRIDTEILADIRVKLNERLAIIEDSINKIAGTTSLNINSPKQLGELLYLKIKITDKPKQTKTGQFKTDEETLQELKERHPIVEQILEYRGLRKLLNTYVDTLPLLINPRTGRIHTSFNQAVTATGRLSSTNPNLQNIPIRDQDGREIRRAIVPGHNGNVIVAADYSQVELRIMAHLSGDKNMIAAFAAGEDIHTATAAKIYNITPGEVTRDQRRKAKTANFGIIYGISAFGLSTRLNIPRAEAKELIDNYFIHFPDVKRYMENAANTARTTGYVETIFSRRRYLNDINSANNVTRSLAERNAINAPIQGSAADIMKLAMIGVWRRLRSEGFKSRLLLQVHDEIVLEAPLEEVDRLKAMLHQEMSGAANLVVPLDIEIGVGENWLEAH